jgi:hypothetical protein
MDKPKQQVDETLEDDYQGRNKPIHDSVNPLNNVKYQSNLIITYDLKGKF